MRGAALLGSVVLAAGRGTFRGYINPLKYYNTETGSYFGFKLEDGESQEELTQAIGDFFERRDIYRETLSQLSQRRKGRARCDISISTDNLWPIAERIMHAGVALDGRYVNIGANDGVIDDPLSEYVRNLNATGVAVERDPALCARHQGNFPQVRVACSAVTPQNVVALVSEGWAPPMRADILKIDIDSYDCSVAEALLEVFEGKFVLLEANPSIPPPYQWAMLYHQGLWDFFNSQEHPEEVPIRGCSLAYEIDLLSRFGYDFLAFGGHDALFVHRSLRDALAPLEPPMDEFECYNEAFIAANGIPISLTRRWFFEVNDTHTGLTEIWDFFTSWMVKNVSGLFPFALRI
eukprot:gnl/TRDRNA2_/TRDRNA2_55898_c0_seq1.p1 gnl/TRDRNA2_/TRDRNA2_55898_c0~~gnl/TRDRNA2_/TRDRNA2_55898_c0_seq1.p1  ORF type:complete len:349 (+),score=48.57 gnl/TRDRNA2_/TRDRNA2_55898_c0_seq1:57-1103(+)